MAEKTQCTLICDARERHVLRHEHELKGITYETQQITTGDYVVLSPVGAIMAVIERKSLEDFAASLKDGRHSNKDKLVELRRETDCRIIFIIEGPEFPQPNTCFGNIPYRYIESSIFHLMIRDNVTTMRTRDSLDTAKTLARFMQSMDSLCKKDEYINAKEVDTTKKDTDENTTVVDVRALLVKRHEKSDHDIVRELWSCFPGIAVESADEYMKKWSIADIVAGRATNIRGFKLASGRKIGKKAAESLSNVTKLLQIRVLGTIPNISHSSAVHILKDITLRNLLSWNADGLSMVFMTANKRRLGPKLAADIIRLFNYKYVPDVPSIEHTEQIVTPPITIDDPDISDLLNLL